MRAMENWRVELAATAAAGETLCLKSKDASSSKIHSFHYNCLNFIVTQLYI